MQNLPALSRSLPSQSPFPWQVGEHLTVCGQTGQGKSLLLSHLLEQRRYKIVFRSKADPVKWGTQKTIREAEGLKDARYDSFTLAPKFEEQAREFYEALEYVFKTGGWSTVLDEAWDIGQLVYRRGKDRMQLGKTIIPKLLSQGRSLHVSMVSGLQRPTGVTRWTISQSTHVLSFRMEGRDAKELSLATSPFVEDVVAQLPEYHFVWYRRPNRLWVGKLDLGEGILHGEYVR